MSAFPYAGWVGNAVRGVKYAGERDRAYVVGAILAATGAGELLRDAEMVVPVPMHQGRERERGYNQAELLASGACRSLGLPPPVRLLVQLEPRRSQVGLTARERQTNLRGAFSVDEAVESGLGRRIVIVDDVRTTGATLMSCVDALRPVRPSRIDIVTFAAEISDEALAALYEQR